MSCLGNPDLDFEGMRFLKQLGRYVKSMGSALSVFSFFEYARIDLNLTLCMNSDQIAPSNLMDLLKADLVLPGMRPINLQLLMSPP